MSKLIVSTSILILSFFYILCAEENKNTLAVLNFKSKHLSEGDIIALSNKISQDLFNTQKFAVFERDLVEEILKEQGFQQSVCSNTKCAVEIGKMLSVENICMGSIDKVGSNTIVIAKIVNVKTAKIEKMATSECENCSVTDIYRHTIRSVVDQMVNVSVDPSKDNTVGDLNLEPANIQSTTGTASKVSLYIVPKLGLNISGLNGNYVDYNTNNGFVFKPKAGLVLGSGFGIVFNKMLAFEPGVYFSMSGNSEEKDSTGYKGKNRINFIELPFNIKLSFPVNDLFSPYLFFSPMLNFRTSAHHIYSSWYTIEKNDDWNGNTRGAEFALSFGAGSQFNVYKTLLSLETRFKFGLTNLAKESKLSIKTSNISFVLGTGFKVK